MRFNDEVIASYLNEEWRTPPAVHRLLGSRGTCEHIAYALERLARAGKIEAKHEAAMTGRAGPPVLCIDYYRKLQKWPKSSSVGNLPRRVTDTKGRQQPARKKPASAATAAPRTEYDRQAKRKARRVKSAGLRSAQRRESCRPARSEAALADAIQDEYQRRRISSNGEGPSSLCG